MNEMHAHTSLYIISVHLTTQKQIELLKWESVEEIDFAGNGYCTDQVIYTIRAAKKVSL